jgi:hypothetical protein
MAAFVPVLFACFNRQEGQKPGYAADFALNEPRGILGLGQVA